MKSVNPKKKTDTFVQTQSCLFHPQSTQIPPDVVSGAIRGSQVLSNLKKIFYGIRKDLLGVLFITLMYKKSMYYRTIYIGQNPRFL